MGSRVLLTTFIDDAITVLWVSVRRYCDLAVGCVIGSNISIR